MARTTRQLTAFVCFAGGLLACAPSSIAQPAECFPGPDFRAEQGTRWEYRRDPISNEGCWYLKQTGQVSRRGAGRGTQPSFDARPTRSVASRDAPREENLEERPSQPFTAWFWSEPQTHSNSRQAYTTAAEGEAATGEPRHTPKRRRDDASTAPKQPQRSKVVQQSKVAQRKLETVESTSARVQGRYGAYGVSLLEAAGDKPVSNMPVLVGQTLKKAIEAVGDKDVVIPFPDLKEDWQKALYAEFLRWRARQFISP
jgi:hypothetical protein